MIAADYSQVFISTLMGELQGRKDIQIDLSLVRHMTLNVLLGYRTKYAKRFGELVLCCDGDRYWRRELFDLYKFPRKKAKEDSGYDWKAISECMDIVQAEIAEFFPYPVVSTPRAEGDDCIAILADWVQTNDYQDDAIFDEEPRDFLIMSSDTDLFQTHKYKNVKQCSPMLMGTGKPQVKSDVPLAQFKLEHILTGDAGDGIPNVLMPQTFFKDKVSDESNPQRQKPITAKIKEFYQEQIDAYGEVREFRDEHTKKGTKIISTIPAEAIEARYKFNEKLVIFDHIPQDVRDDVIASYKSQLGKDRSMLLDYFIKYKLKNLMPQLQDF